MDHTLKTDRLSLLPLDESDMGFMRELMARPETYHYDLDSAMTSDEVELECRQYRERSKELPDGGAIRWIVKSDDVTSTSPALHSL